MDNLGHQRAAARQAIRGRFAIAATGTALALMLMAAPAARAADDQVSAADQNCLACHGAEGMEKTLADGDKLSLAPQWTSPDMIMPDPPVAANGVLYATSTGGQAFQNMHKPGEARFDYIYGNHFRAVPVGNLTLYAFDAQTGKQLYSSKKAIADWVHFGEPVVALGKVFLVTHDAHVYAFGLKR